MPFFEPLTSWIVTLLADGFIVANEKTKAQICKLPKNQESSANKYPEPHRDANGKIIIENSLLYKEDVKKYGAYQAMQWVKQGKYNLTPEELKKEDERLQAEHQRLLNLLK